MSSQTPPKAEGQPGEALPSPATGRGRMLVDLVSHLERSMHEVAHVFPAVDHMAQPLRPAAADAERIEAQLSTKASPELNNAFERWRGCRREFLGAAARLETVRRRETEPDYQLELERDIELLRAMRAELLRAAEELRASTAHEIDG